MFEFDQRITIESLPNNVSDLAAEEKSERKLLDSVLHIDAKNQHQYLESNLDDDYYDEYLMTATFSEKMQRHQEAQARKLARLCRASAPSFVEIGCGDGSFLKHASTVFDSFLGVEPSKLFAKEVRDKGFEVIEAYLDRDAIVTDRRFDAFATRQVFEHLERPLDVLVGIRNHLRAGAVGLIEVPNGLRSLMDARYYDFFPDHCQYYSVTSLTKLANEAGFVVLSCNTSFSDDYLELWVQYQPDFAGLAAKLAESRDKAAANLNQCLSDWLGQQKRIAIWGVGAKTLSIMPLISDSNAEGILFAIDSDPHKHDRYIPGTQVAVREPSQLTDAKVDIVFVLALSYREEIAEQARMLTSGKAEIYTIDNTGQVIQIP
jgi:cyclopropane fatty-acyl-phospholipid synthase-like methyltransferase